MKKLPLSNSNDFGLVDDDKFERASEFRWGLQPSGYIYATINGETVLLHRFVMDAKKGEEVDHKDQDKKNCQSYNLRRCTHSQNLANTGIRPHNRVGYKGVDRQQGKFRATIRVNYKKIFLGYHDTPEQAALAYNTAAKEHFGEFAFLNIIPQESL